ncbi:MAG: MFS transporter [Deltaproteobacteria bacterium]|nr:MFS transporter [Deltaproteobacteria bacterium]
MASRFPSARLLQKNHLFRDFLAASTISLLGTSIFDIAMPLYVLQRTHSAIALSLVTVGLTLPFSLMAPLTGYLADHFDKRRVMLGSDIGQVLFLCLLLGLEFSGMSALWPILVIIFCAKTLMILFETVTTFQLVPALVDKEDLSDANACFLSSYRLIQIVGPLAGGILMGTLGVRVCILINVLSFGATLYFVYKMKNLSEIIDGAEKKPFFSPLLINPREVFRNFSASLKYVWQSKLFRPFVLLMFLWNMTSLAPTTPSMTYYFTELHLFTSSQYGLVISVFGLIGILGYLGAGSIYRHYQLKTIFIFSAVWQATLASLAALFVSFPTTFIVLFAFSRFGASLLSMGTFLLRQTEIPKNITGGVNSCLRMFFMSAAPLSAFLQGILVHHFGVIPSFVLGSVCLWGTFFFSRNVAVAYQGRRIIRKIDPEVETQAEAA